jgi:hypothetical protein
MRSKRTKRFRALFDALPLTIQQRANAAYKMFKADPFHAGLHFKPIDPADPTIYSARVGNYYRAVGTRRGDLVVWFWIGTHSEYDNLF